LLNHVLTTHDVSKIANLDQILKYNLGYHELMPIKTSLDYLHHLRKDVFAMIRQFRPLTFFVTFSTSVNKWSILMKTFKKLHIKQFQHNVKTIFNNSLTNKDFVKSDSLHVYNIMNT